MKRSMKPWITNEIINMIGHRDRLFHQKKDNPLNQRIKNAYNLFRNRVTREIKKAKNKYYNDYFENNLNNMKKTWQGIKQIINLNNETGPQISQLCYEGKQINSNKSMANAFNDFFNKIGTKLDEEIPICKKPEGIIYYLSERIPYSFLIFPTTPLEIIDIITNLDGSKSSGPCSVPTKMLKLVVKEISIPFNDICITFTESTFPDKNKMA